MCVRPVLYLHYCQCSMTCKLVLYCMHVYLHYCQRSVLCMRVLYCVYTTANIVCYVCKSCVVFALLPAQYVVCVSPVLCLLNVLPAQFAVRGLRQVLLLLFYFAIFCTTASAVCCVCKSCVAFALLPVQCAVCVSPVFCLLNVLPAQFAVLGLRQVLLLLFYFAFFLHYCQRNVLCV